MAVLAALAAQLVLVAGAPAARAVEPPKSEPGAPGGEPGASDGEPGASEDEGGDPVGEWLVEPGDAGSWTVSWRSPSRLPVGGDRPLVVVEPGPGGPELTEVEVPTVADDGRTVTTTITAATRPDPDLLDVRLSGRVLDEAPPDGGREGRAPAPRWTEPERRLLDVDPGRPGTLATVSSDYALPGLRLPGLPQPVEMAGHVVEPADRDPSRPLVLFLHGRHGWCYAPGADHLTWEWPCVAGSRPVPSHLGYHYLQELLASQGYVTVSVAANGVNAQDDVLLDAGAAARARLVRAHLDRWAGWVRSGARQADLRRTVLVGHSRGGEGVARAALELPLTAPYRIAGQVLLAPTDFARQTTPFVPTVTALPTCDGDVSDLQGQTYTDASRRLIRGDTSLKSSLLVVGANHNFFNTEWTPGLAQAPAEDDWWFDEPGACASGASTRLTAAEQRRVASAYVSGAVRLFTAPAVERERVRPLFDGDAVRVHSTGDAVVLSHALGGGRVVRAPGAGARATAPRQAASLVCEGTTPTGSAGASGRQCGRFAGAPDATPHWPLDVPRTVTHQALELAWTAAGARGGLAFATALDLRGAASLDLRTVVDPRLGDVRVSVRVGDAAGRVVTTPARTVPALPRGPAWYAGKHWAQTVRVEAASLRGLDRGAIVTAELVARSGDGRVWLLDAAARPAALAAVPARRAALVDLGEVAVREGGPGPHVARVPFRVVGALAQPAAFRVFAGDDTSAPRRLDVTVPAGATRGVLRWSYAGNRRDGFRQQHDLAAYAVHGAMVRDSWGRVVIRDDDPTPRFAFEPVRPAVAEGEAAAWRLLLSAPVDYDLGVQVSAVAGPTRGPAPVRVDDIGRGWLQRWVWYPPGTNPPLHRTEVGYYATLAAGRTAVRVEVPIRQDDRVEGAEAVTLRARTFERDWTSGPATVLVERGR